MNSSEQNGVGLVDDLEAAESRKTDSKPRRHQ